MSSITTVPEDILREILAFCSANPLTISAVCQYWRYLCHDIPSLWTQVSLDVRKPASMLLAGLYLSHCRDQLLYTTIVSTSHFQEEQVKLVLPFIRRTKHLYAPAVIYTAIGPALPAATIESLAIKSHIGTTDSHSRFIIDFPRLRTLTFFSIFESQALPGYIPYSQITRLKIGSSATSTVLLCARYCTAIEELSLDRIYEIQFTNPSLYVLIHCSKLRILHCSEMPDTVMQTLYQRLRCPSLRELKLQWAYHLAVPFVGKWMESMSSVTSLCLGRMSDTAVPVSLWAKMFPELKQFELDSEDQSDLIPAAVKALSPHLEVAKIAGRVVWNSSVGFVAEVYTRPAQ